MSLIQIARNNRLAALASMEARMAGTSNAERRSLRTSKRSMPTLLFRHHDISGQVAAV